MKDLQRLPCLNDIESNYDLFLFDLCGVLHDDRTLFPEASEIIRFLKEKHKLVVLLSNSPKHTSTVAGFLADHGLSMSEYTRLVTSFEYFKHFINKHPSFVSKKKFFNVGKNQLVFDSVKLDFTTKIENADYIIISFFKENISEPNEWQEAFAQAMKKNITAICLNPDITAPHGDLIRYTPGYFAREYEDLGGRVIYFGKPHLGIYEFALNDLMNSHNITKNKILAIGDSLLTDIKGANNFGIDSLLVYARGVHKEQRLQEMANVQKLCSKHQSYPTYIADKISL